MMNAIRAVVFGDFKGIDVFWKEWELGVDLTYYDGLWAVFKLGPIRVSFFM